MEFFDRWCSFADIDAKLTRMLGDQPVQIVQLKLWMTKDMCWNKKKSLNLDIFTLYFFMGFQCVSPLPTRTGIKIQRGVICPVANKVRESRCISLIFWTSCEVLFDSIPPKKESVAQLSRYLCTGHMWNR